MDYVSLVKTYFSLLSERNKHLFMVWCVERFLIRTKNIKPRDFDICIAALNAKKKWVDGKITDEALGKARDCVWVVSARADYIIYGIILSIVDATRIEIKAHQIIFDYNDNQECKIQLCEILEMLAKQIKGQK